MPNELQANDSNESSGIADALRYAIRNALRSRDSGSASNQTSQSESYSGGAIMSDRLPVSPSDLEHDHIRAAAPAFFGFDWYEEGTPTSPSPNRVITYRDGNVVTLDGNSGPWFARQLFGPYAGVLMVHWDDTRVLRDADILADELNLVVCRKHVDTNSSNVDDDNCIEMLFTDEARQVQASKHACLRTPV